MSIDDDIASSPTPPRLLNSVLFVLALLGTLLSTFLWRKYVTHEEIPCGGANDCDAIAASPYARFPVGNGLYVPLIGMIGYASMAILAFARTLVAANPSRDRLLLGLFVLAAAGGTAFSLWLTYIALAVLGQHCKWCLTSQAIILTLFILAIIDWRRTERHQRLLSATIS